MTESLTDTAMGKMRYATNVCLGKAPSVLLVVGLRSCTTTNHYVVRCNWSSLYSIRIGTVDGQINILAKATHNERLIHPSDSGGGQGYY